MTTKSPKESSIPKLRAIVKRKQAEIRGEASELCPHPAADVFPMIDPDAFNALKVDIERNGQRVPIAMYGGAVLDGRNRLRACRELGIEPVTVEVPLEVDPWTYVVSLNLRRRHLAPHQAGAIYAKLLEQRGGRKTKPGPKGDAATVAVSLLASELGVPVRTMRHQIAAAETYAQLEPATKAAVDAGDITLDQAVGKPKKKAKVKKDPRPAETAPRKPAPTSSREVEQESEESADDSEEDVFELEPIVPYPDITQAIDAFNDAMSALVDRWPAEYAGMLIKMLRNQATQLEARRQVNG